LWTEFEQIYHLPATLKQTHCKNHR